MGQFTEVDIRVSFNNSDKAKEFEKIIGNFNEEVKNRRLAKGLTDSFYSSITKILNEDDEVFISLCSERTPNAEWQTEQINEIAKEFKEYIEVFDAVETIPESIIYWDANDLDEEDDE